MTSTKSYPKTALALLTALNLLNYIDRSVLFAVQDLLKAEFHRSDFSFGVLTSVFFVFYMCAAPFMGPLSLRFSRKWVIVVGALVWSAATLLTAVTYDFTGLVIRHTLVGIGEASFVILSPTFVADMKHLMANYDSLQITVWTLNIGSALLFVGIECFDPVRFHFSPAVWSAAASQGLLATAVAYLAWNWGLEQIPASRAGVFLNLEPLIGTLLGVVLLNERLGAAAILGGALILGPAIYFSRKKE